MQTTTTSTREEEAARALPHTFKTRSHWLLPAAGGRAAARVGHPHLPAIGVRATAETAAEANGCTGSVDTNATQAAHAWDALAPTALVARRAYTGCAADVVFDVVDDLGHWPAFGVLQTDLRGPLLFAIYGEPLVLPADDDAHDACRAAIPPKWGS